MTSVFYIAVQYREMLGCNCSGPNHVTWHTELFTVTEIFLSH